jgi:excinuclease ABC subunit C
MQLGEKTRLLVSQIKKIRITIVESELEALLLEAFYIKKFNPRFNIRLTDNKAYILVRITIKDSYPKVLLSRRMENPNDLYFGPFPNSSAVKLVLKIIRKVFPYQSVINHPKRICLYNHLGLCPCPPVNDTPKLRKIYNKNIEGILRVFKGEAKKIISEFEKERNKLSKNEDFEKAAILQKRINALSYITQPFHKPYEYDLNPNLRSDIRQQELENLKNTLASNGCGIVSLERIECYDISHIQGTNTVASMIVFLQGEKEPSQYRKFKIRSLKKRNVVAPSSQIQSLSEPYVPNDFASMQEILTRRFRHEEWSKPGLIIVDGGKGQVSAAINALHNINLEIPLIGLAKREETIVIPVIQNPNIEYRNTKQAPGKNFKDGKRTENIKRSITMSNYEFRISSGTKQYLASNLHFIEVNLSRDAKELHLLMRIRDEAHRFAISYHRKLRSKAAIL